ncbi:hypothetical protein BAJUN_02370 [Bajunvirus bajun]|uniref:Uncharacterized protein n=1 Tax=Brevundimonas phage vB_BgoS-Bajun TaxID=2948594 RepID=A0A9E7N784_9CAUD|nr:hypothetical protein BAJUN_02370 [Brevundimonas phage vB_BgoS-Bajun]
MSNRVRIYSPLTNEPFDVTEARATKLRLDHGWLSQPYTETGDATDLGTGIGEDTGVVDSVVRVPDSENTVIDWRDMEQVQTSDGPGLPDHTESETPPETDVEEEPAAKGRGRGRKSAETAED